MEQRVTWNRGSHGAEGHMEQRVTWGRGSHGAEGHMGQMGTWNRRSHGTEGHMEQKGTWSRGSHGAEGHMGQRGRGHMEQRVTWSRGAHGAEGHMGQRGTWGRGAHGAEGHMEQRVTVTKGPDWRMGQYNPRSARASNCVETPKVIGNLYVINPLGSHTEFEWGCKTPGLNYTEITTFDSAYTLDYAVSWQQVKQGIPLYGGFYILGLENLHQLTKQGMYDMFIILYILGKPFGHLHYRNFRVDSEAEGYALHWDHFEPDTNIFPGSDEYLDGFGGAGDPNKNLNGARFGTYDNDVNGCAGSNNAAWWYNPLGCTAVKFASDGLHWPTNRTGTYALEQVFIAVMGMNPVYWYVHDDLVL
ncbi:microfibril-associated glycoprotein 4-like [Haliotis cracherodii]|uniref:microfibril-associated glycoprotein 4-like n=1 Tax=Haliotis cracherodii TaxID=6455 RepID=UPI0039EBADE6